MYWYALKFFNFKNRESVFKPKNESYLINSYERPHKCNACNKSFSFQSRNPSATYHSDIYTFICSKIFNTGTLQYSNLIYHIISKAQTRREYVYIYLWSRSSSCWIPNVSDVSMYLVAQLDLIEEINRETHKKIREEMQKRREYMKKRRKCT